jgi:hypothetical protein
VRRIVVLARAPALLLVSTLALPAPRAQPAVVAFSAPAPEALAAGVRSLLSDAAQKVTVDDATLEFWWVRELQTTGGAAKDWSQVPEGAIVGAARVTGAFKEIRGQTVNPGVYTLRFGLQPQNGDHLGASPHREYLLLSPAAADGDPKPLGFDGTVAISKQTIGTSHPAALSLDPPVSTAAVLSPHGNDMDHKGVTFEVKTAGGGSLRFGLIVSGLIEH